MATDHKAKHARVLAGMQRLAPELAEAEACLAGDPRETVRRTWVLERELGRYPASDLQSFDARRAHNELATAIGKLRTRAATALGEAQAADLLADLDFAAQSLELFGQVARRRHEAVTLDLSEFVNMERPDRREVAEALHELCDEIQRTLSKSATLEREVASWGPENVSALARDTDPAIPEGLLPPKRGRAALVLGVGLLLVGGAGVGVGIFGQSLTADPRLVIATGSALVVLGIGAIVLGVAGVAASARERAVAPPGLKKRFHELSTEYRQRVYMSAALRILRHKVTLVEKAEEAFRKFTAGESAPRWKTLCSNKELVRGFFEWSDGRPLKDSVSYAVNQAIGPKGRLRPFDEMAAEGWEVLLKAFLLDVFDDEARHFDAIAPFVAEEGLSDEELERVAKATLDAWHSKVE